MGGRDGRLRLITTTPSLGQRPSQVSMIVRRGHGSKWGAVSWIWTVVSGEVSTGLSVAPGS